MRTFWLIVVAVVLLGGTVGAQEPRGQRLFYRSQPDGDWAVGYQNQPAASPTAPSRASSNYAMPANQPAAGMGPSSRSYSGYPAPALAVPPPPAAGPVAAPTPPPPASGTCCPASGGCCGGGDGCDKDGHDGHCLARIKQWLCYRPIQGGCGKCGSCCNYNCFLPLYLYFLGECHEGNCHTMPTCIEEKQSCGWLGKLGGRCCSSH